MPAIWLSESDVRGLLEPRALLDVMETALADYSAGRAVQPVRTVIECAERSFFASMPVRMTGSGALGAKLVTVFPGNAARGKPTHLATIALFDPHTGELLALMDGRYITEVRTAAVSAVSMRYLAPPEASVLAILGSGAQARSHLKFLNLVHPFSEIRCWSPQQAHRLAFAGASPGVRACESAQEAVDQAGIIVLATSSSAPVLRSEWVRPGVHLIAVGACRPHDREIDPALVARARLVVDSRESALKESGDVILAIAEGWIGEGHITAELGEVIAGARPGRAGREEITMFKSLGLAVEDIAAAHLVYGEAIARGRGLPLDQPAAGAG